MLQTLETLFALDRTAQMFHENIQDDKRAALLAVSRLMAAAGAEYVISGGLATQLHVSDPRFTGDVDVVARFEDAERIIEQLQHPSFSDEFEFVVRQRNWTQAAHRASGTPIDINTSPLFRHVLAEPDHVELEGQRLPIAAAVRIAYTKLRTQQRRWPRTPRKRLIDRADVMQLLEDNPGLYERLRGIAEPRLHNLLDEIHAESQVEVDPYPDFEDEREFPPDLES